MTDSPYFKAPTDTKEQPILEKLLDIRTTLELLNRDRGNYIKSADIVELYGKVNEQVCKLNDIRVDKRDEQNRVDSVLDDCLQLISLSYLTIGRKNEAPAVYSFISTIKRLLDHLREAAFFSPKDLESIEGQLKHHKDIIEHGRSNYDPALLTLLEVRLTLCEHTLAECKGMLSHLTPEMTPTYEKLVSILRTLSACNTKTKFPTSEVKDFQAQIKEIEKQLNEESLDMSKLAEYQQIYIDKMRHYSQSGLEAPEENRLLRELLRRCAIWSEIMIQKQGKLDPRFQDKYEKLLTIKKSLDNLQLTYTWSMRETDLYNFQRQLNRIDEARVDGNWVDADGKPADLFEQRTLLYLLRKSYAMIYHLLVSSEPVSEALQPIYNQLTTLKRCLTEVQKAGGVSSPRELYPYSMKLNSIDNMRVDGKFMVGEDIPDGQGAVNALLAECFDLAYDLRAQAEEDSEKADTPEGSRDSGIVA